MNGGTRVMSSWMGSMPRGSGPRSGNEKRRINKLATLYRCNPTAEKITVENSGCIVEGSEAH